MKSAVLLGLFVGLVSGCNDGSYESPKVPSLKLEFTNLPDLGAQYVYEGWLVSGGVPVSSGRFTVNEAGVLSSSRFTIAQSLYDSATTFVLTIEPKDNDPAAASAQHLLAGDFSGGNASLMTSHAAALKTDFASSTGSFLLATPTTSENTDEDAGIWWLKMVGGSPMASLTLPTLPTGWAYEGWVVVGGVPLTTGRFTSVTGADSDGKGPEAGPLGGPPFPGQDFITPLRRLPGGMAVITVEPEPDNSPKPFALKPLTGPIGNLTGGANNHSMQYPGMDKLPSGKASLSYY